MPSILSMLIERQTAPTGPVDMSTNAPSIIAINGFFTFFTLVIVTARMYVRSVMLKTVGADDYVIMVAMICGIGVFTCFVGETKNGIGRHENTITVPELETILHWQFFHSIIVMVGISLIKISIACFLMRLATGKWHKRFLMGMIVFLVAFTIACAGVSRFQAHQTLIFACVPVNANWDLAAKPTATCYSNNTFTAIGLFNSCVNIVTDVLFATLPIPIVWNLQVNNRTRISLIAILSLGFFACAAAIVKTILQAQFFATPDYTRNDSYFIWNSVELHVGIIAACLPALRPLFASILETTRALATRRTGMSSSGVAGVRHKYYVQEDGIGMNSLSGKRSGKYDVRVTTRSNLGRAESEEDFGIGKGDAESDENILPMQMNGRGITKTVNVSVT